MWSCVSSGLVQPRNSRLFSGGQKLSCSVDEYDRKLRACKDLDEGRRLHSEIVDRGFGRDTCLGNLLVKVYGSFDSFEDATSLFAHLQKRNVFSWNILLHAYAQSGHVPDSRDVFRRMPEHSIVSWNDMLGALGCLEAKPHFDEMPARNEISWTTLATGFARNERVDEAVLVLHRMPGWNTVACTMLVGALARVGDLQEARAIFLAMPQRSSVSWNVFITACALHGCLDGCVAVFGRMPARDIVSWNSLMQAYADNSCEHMAKTVFDAMPVHNLVSCNALIAAYTARGMLQNAKLVFDRMSGRDVLSWVLVARGAAAAGCWAVLEQLVDRAPWHSLVARNVAFHAAVRNGQLQNATAMFTSQYHRDLFSWTTMVVALAEQQPEQAKQVFMRMACWDVTAWNALLAGYSRVGDVTEVKLLFDRMVERDLVSWTGLISVCGDFLDEALHRVPARDIVLWNIAAGTYAQCGRIQQAKFIFDAMDERDTVSWNTLVSAYAQAGDGQSSLAAFCAMVLEGLPLDSISYMSLIEAVNADSNSSLSLMREVHELIAQVDNGRLLVEVTKVANALLNMYAKRGLLNAAQNVFDGMQAHARDVITWSTLIVAYASACFSTAALDQTLRIFRTMQLHGIQADSITLVSLLTACSQAGHVACALELFVAIATEDFIGVATCLEHCVCLIDLMARSGQLADADELVNVMPFEPNALVWQTLLGCSKDQLDLRIGRRAFRRLLEMLPPGAAALSSAYLLLLQISMCLVHSDI